MTILINICKGAALGLLTALSFILLGCGGGGSAGGSGAATITPTFKGFYQGTLSPTGPIKAKPAVSPLASSFTLSVQMNGSSGTANFSQSNPLLNYTAGINNIIYNKGTKELSFTMSNFSAVYTTANFTGSVTTDASNQITNLTGTFTAAPVGGGSVSGTFSLDFKVGVAQANFTGNWSGTVTATVILGTPTTYNWTGTWTQTGNTVSGTISYVDGSGTTQTVTFPSGQNGKGAVTGNVMTAQAQAPFSYNGLTLTANGSLQATLTDTNTMTGQFDFSTKDGTINLPDVLTGTFTATRTVVNTKSAVQFVNYTVQTTSPLLGKIGSTALGTAYVAAGQVSGTGQVSPGTFNFTLTPKGSSGAIVNSNYSFDGSFRELFVALDDTLSGGTTGKPVVKAFPISYPNTNTLPSGDIGLTIVEGVDTSVNGFGTNVDFYVYPSGGQMPSTPTAANLAYGQNVQLKLAAGSYIIASYATGTNSSLATSTAMSLTSSGQYYVTAVVSPLTSSAIFDAPSKLFQ